MYYLLVYLKYTVYLVLTLKANNINIIKWWWLNVKKNIVFSKNTKQKINTKSFTKTEIIGINNVLSQVL